MKHSSDLLLHFVGRAHRQDPAAQVEVCASILTRGFRFAKSRVDLGSSIGALGLEWGPMAVCFTDIPLRLSEGHAARYGKCAIGVRKELVKRWGGNPVLYLVDRRGEVIPIDLQKRTDLRGLFGDYMVNAIRILAPGGSPIREHWSHSLTPAQREGLMTDFGWIVSHVKEMFDLGPDIDEEDEPRRDRYYLEREWRVCQANAHEAIANNPESGLVRRHEGSLYLPLAPKDVRVVVVPNDTCRRTLVMRLTEAGWKPDDIPSIVAYEDSKDL
jgi:hypothetical protein